MAGPAVPADADALPTPAGNVIHGFWVDDDGDFHLIDHPEAGATHTHPIRGGTGTSTTGINNRREVVGGYADRSDVIRNFLRSRNGRYTIIAPPDSFPNEELADINNRGEIVGFVDEDGDNSAGTRGLLRTRGGRYEAIEVSGAASTVALKVKRSPPGRRHLLRSGSSRRRTAAGHGFVWDHGEVTIVDHPDAANGTFLFGINNRGDTVG